MGQISQQLAERQWGSMLSNTIANPRNEHVKAITLRNGKELAEPERLEEALSTKAKTQASKGYKYEIPMRCSRGEKDE